MGKFLNPGNEAFKISISSEIYVDKTEIISFTNSKLGQEKRFICVSRPRRFGKSMAANMLCAYYSKENDSKELFYNLKIEQHDNFEQHLNQYDVIYLNIQHFLRMSGRPENLVNYIEEKVLTEIKNIYNNYVDADDTSLPEALASVFDKDKRPDKGFIFVIDEWDCIFREYKNNESAHKYYLDFLKDLFKDRTYVKLAYMTGILPIKKYGTHSALNIFDEFSMTDPGILTDFVGFTEDEVKTLCQHYQKDFGEAQRWYDGYRFSDDFHVYNPKAVVDAMCSKRFKSFWTSTETYEALRVYIDMNFDGLRDAVIGMLGGIGCKIDTETFQNDMTNFAVRDDVLTLLVHLGYLAYDENNQEVFIPNEEVREEFVRAIRKSGWNKIVKAVEASEKLLNATLNQDEEAVAKGLDAIHSESTSILSYNDENSLSCVVSLAYYSAKKDYTFIRELHTGKGFADIVFLPRRHLDKPALIVELKWDMSAEGAIKQIHDRQYVKALDDYKGNNILLVGINYDKKKKNHQCVIEEVLY